VTLLCDTQILLWFATRSPRLTPAIQDLIEATDEVWFSVVSIWEVALKRTRHRGDFPYEAPVLRASLLANDFREIAVEGAHALAVADLPPHHGDPYDRMLVAQARAEGLMLLTADRTLAAYGPPVRLV